MEFKITHEAYVEAETEEEARISYVELWETGWYSLTDLDVELAGKESSK